MRKLVRASVAAPFYFSPVSFEVKAGNDGERAQSGAFVDGAVSMAGNPALELFLVATLKGFPFDWQKGEDHLMLVSVGSGTWSLRDKPEAVLGANVVRNLRRTISMLMSDTDWAGQTLLQAMSNSPTRWPVDREIGDLRDDLVGDTPALHYLRYNVELEPEALTAIGLGDLADRAERLRDGFASGERLNLLRAGSAAGQASIVREHFPPGFMRPASQRAHAASSASLTHDRVQATLLTADVALRNLRITQFYGEAAAAITALIGSRDVTWFGFGCRASKSVGRIIRIETVPKFAQGPLLRGQARRPLAPLVRFLLRTRALMADGNVLVFEELGPLACDFLAEFGGGEGDIERFVGALRPGTPAVGGQDLLKTAFRAWHAAAREADSGRKAQLVLLGNCSAVFHEQQRLQPLLNRSLEVPILDGVVQDAARRRVAGWPLRRLRPVGNLVRAGWQRFATNTKAFAAYDLSEMSLGLGADVRGFAPGIDFPAALRTLDEPDLLALWSELGAPESSTAGSATTNWASLPDRMQYIATVFRSRQQDLGLLAPPFSRHQVEAIDAGIIPKGPL
ncbi:MAG: hypothetical protein ACKVVT_09530 [Dehalococcoidia bacterium]